MAIVAQIRVDDQIGRAVLDGVRVTHFLAGHTPNPGLGLVPHSIFLQ